MLDLIFPEACSVCDTPVSDKYPVCDSCTSEVKFVSDYSSCDRCGTPFGFFSGDSQGAADTAPPPAASGHLCGRCLRGGFSFDRARSVVIYEGMMRDMIHEFKYRGRLGLEGFLVSLMIERFPYPRDVFNVVVPVPMHITKLREREYNQSAVLAYGLARSLGVECGLRALRKIRDTRPQFELGNEEERRRNVRGAFSAAFPGAFKDKSVLLVDDVFTTGSTSDECSREILKSGAARVTVFTLSRAKGI
ncbi:MAG: ComF family protein [Candidatus Dadabacteria bacterium]|nr:MAG: ComF family protein [Candidatus Dadabacteria bacterium]